MYPIPRVVLLNEPINMLPVFRVYATPDQQQLYRHVHYGQTHHFMTAFSFPLPGAMVPTTAQRMAS